ncbi:MAG: hypothetical protein ACKVWV_01350 [Planctomycetota bacterium]
MSKLEQAVHEFLERRLLAERIDDLPLSKQQRAARKADYLLRERAVIVEVKDIVDDREARVNEVVGRWRRRPGWPKTYGTLDIQDFLRLHPQREQINKELSEAVTCSLDGVLRNANRQIRATKKSFELPAARGTIFLVNDSIDLFEPKVLGAKLDNLLKKERGDGTRCFPHADSIVVFTAAHRVVESDGAPSDIVMTICLPPIDPAMLKDSFEHFVIEEWAAFKGLPLLRTEFITTPEQIDAVRLVGKRPPLEI